MLTMKTELFETSREQLSINLKLMGAEGFRCREFGASIHVTGHNEHRDGLQRKNVKSIVKDCRENTAS